MLRSRKLNARDGSSPRKAPITPGELERLLEGRERCGIPHGHLGLGELIEQHFAGRLVRLLLECAAEQADRGLGRGARDGVRRRVEQPARDGRRTGGPERGQVGRHGGA